MSDSRASKGRLFLTGATGHTGCRVARRLLADGWSLRCLVHTPERAKYLPESDSLEIIAGDLARPAEWADHLAECEAMIHMAHIGFADDVVIACRNAGISRVIAFSSTRRYTRFVDPTAERVIRGELAFEQSDLAYTILRPTMIFGGDRDNNLQRVCEWLCRWRFLPRVAGGCRLVQPIYVWDLVDAIERALERSDQTAYRLLTLAGPEPMTWREMIEMLGKALDRPVIWVPIPYWLAFSGAVVLERIMKRPPATRATVRRMLEDKAFDIGEASEALGGWTPRPFNEALAEKMAGRA